MESTKADTSETSRPADAARLLEYVLEAMRFDVLEDSRRHRLLQAEARAAGIQVADQELQACADAFRKANGLLTVEQTRQWLAGRNMSQEDFEKGLEARARIDKLRKKVLDERLAKHWAERARHYDIARLSRITVLEEGAAKELKAKLEEGDANFHELALKYSQEQDTRLAGGYLGLLRRKDMAPEVQVEVFGAERGQVVGPVPNGRQFSLLLVHEIRSPALDEVRAEVEEELWKEWIEERATAG